MAAAGAQTGPDDRQPAPLLAELLLADSLSNLALVLVAILGIALAGAAGWGLLRLQEHFASDAASGQTLSGLTAFLADGSSVRTAWPGWLAAVFFAISILRLARGEPEPPIGRGSPDQQSVSQLRAGLRREYHSVRIALVIVVVVAAVDAGRLAAFGIAALAGDDMARSGLAGTALEAAGLFIATFLLGLWGWLFRRQIERWGAV